MAALRKKKAKKDTSFATWKFDLENTVNADPLADGPCLKLMRGRLKSMLQAGVLTPRMADNITGIKREAAA